MKLDEDDIVTQEETGEAASIDEVEGRVEATMKKLEGKAKKNVADGLQDPELSKEGDRLIEEAKRELADDEE